jgi:sugar phosphate isomerase/epimerase
MAVAKTTVEAAAELGAIHLILHTGTGSFENPASLEAAYEDQRQCFHTLGDFAVQHGVMLMVENIFTMTPQEHTALPSRLASEIAAIGHSHVAACLDFSHASLTSSMRGADFMQEINALAPFTRHLHIHDSFGEPFHLRTYSRAERVAYGLGDLHLPLGWGNLPWGEIMASLEFAPDVIFNLELPHLYAFALKDNVETMRGFRDAYAGRT